MDINIDYIPTDKQALYHASTADEVLYGGAAGGGKSRATVMEAFIDGMENPGIHSYLFRNTYPELRDTLVKEAQLNIPKQLGRYIGSDHDYRLQNGSVLHFRYARNLTDAYTYQGAEMNRLFIDELTKFKKEIVDFLLTRVRAPKSLNVKPFKRFTANPGGVGHGWVKSMFIDALEPYKIHKIEAYSRTLKRNTIVTRQYIPALVTDNPHLTEDYIIQLESLPEALQKALLEGNWDMFEGQVFTEWVNDPNNYQTRQKTHVIDPFVIPSDWKRYRSFDWGYSRPFSVGYWAECPFGRLYRYHEIYGTEKDPVTRITKEPNKGLYMSVDKVADLVKVYEDKYEKGNQVIGYADPSIFADNGMPDGSIARIFERRGIYWQPADNSRIPGKMQVHYRLAFDADGLPMMYVFSNCKDFIRTIPNLVYDLNDVEDVDTEGEDHIYDDTRYMCMARPIKARKNMMPKKIWTPQDDPLNMIERPIVTTPYDSLGSVFNNMKV